MTASLLAVISRNRTVAFKRRSLKRFNHRRIFFQPSGNYESPLGKPIARVKGFGAETAALKGCGKPFQRLVKNRLRAVKCDTPTGQIQLSAILRADLTRAQVVSEIRPATQCGAII